MTLLLRQSTSIDVRIGPFVSPTDGVTPVTGITIAAADQAEVLKANGAATVAMTGTLAAVTGADGWYDYTAAAGDVDTVGEVVFVLQDASASLPCFTRGFVVEEAIYDDLFAAAAIGYLKPTTAGRTLDVAATGEAGVDFSNILGTLDAANIGAAAITAAKFATDAITSTVLATSAAEKIADEVLPTTNTAFNNIYFLMVDATDGRTPEIGLTVTGERSIDGGAFVAVSGTIAEIGNGIYQFDAAAADMNGGAVTFRFTATGASAAYVTIPKIRN